MKLNKEERWKARGYLRRAGLCVVAAAVAGTMSVPAMAFAYNGTPTAGNPYGCGASGEIGTNTLPKIGTDSLYSFPVFNSEGKRYITAACGGSGTAIVDYADIVGLDNIASSSYNWGTRININPNHFAWNDILYTNQDDVTTKSLSGDPTSPSLGLGFVKSGPNGVMTYATVDKYRPDVLCNADLTSYKTIVSAINTADGNSDYSPKYAQISTNTLITQVDSLWAEAEAAEDIMSSDKSTTTRYEDPYEIAENFENYILGMEWYILSQHEQDGTLAKIAYVNGYSDGTITAVGVDPSSAGTSPGRQYEGFEQITKNVVLDNPAWTNTSDTTYTSTDITSLKDCDAIFISISTGGGGMGPRAAADDFQEALDAIGYKGKVCVSPSLSVGNQGFGFSRNLIEYMGYLYPEDLNFAYAIKYWWSKFGHVKDEYIDAIMVDTESTKLLPTGDASADLDTTGYTEDYMNARFAKGISYYNAHKDDTSSYCTHSRLNSAGSDAEGVVNHYTGAATYSLDQCNFAEDITTEDGLVLTEGVDYEVAADGTINGIGGFEGSVAPQVSDQSIKVTPATTTVKLAAAKKKAQKVTLTVSGVQTSLTATPAAAAKKAGVTAKVNSKKKVTVTLKKGIAKGTYKVTLKAKASNAWNAASKTVTIKVK